MKPFIQMAIIVIFLTGCNKCSNSVRYADLQVGDVLVVVDDQRLTKGRMEKDVRFRVALEARRNQRMTISQSKRLEFTLYNSGIDYFVKKQAYRSLAKEMHANAGSEDMKRAQENFMHRFSRGSKKWDDFYENFDHTLRDELVAELAYEALKIKVDKLLGEKFGQPPTDAEVASFQANRKKYNDRMAATNTLIFACASNIWHKIVANRAPDGFKTIGQDAEAGNKHISYDSDWGAFPLSALGESAELCRLLPTAKKGTVFPPLEVDNGLAILKLIDIETDDEPLYRFERVFFELPLFYTELSDAELSKEMIKRRASDGRKRAIADRIKALPCEFPNGKVIFN